jgi:hypothetical protein
MKAEITKYYSGLMYNELDQFLVQLSDASPEEQSLFTQQLRKYNLHLLFYKALMAGGGMAIDRKIVEQLETDYRNEVLHNEIHISFLKKLLQNYSDILILKGIINQSVLGLGVYKKSVDIDVIVPPSLLPELIRFLHTQGFKKRKRYFAYGQAAFESPLINLDLHTILIVKAGLDNIFKLNKVKFHAPSARQVILYRGLALPCLSLDFQFMHLCLHFILHHHFADHCCYMKS